MCNAKPNLLAFHTSHRLRQSSFCQCWISLRFCPEANAQTNHKKNTHRSKNGSALPTKETGSKTAGIYAAANCKSCTACLCLTFAVTNHFTECDYTSAGKQHHGIQLNQVGKNRRIFYRCSRVCTDKSAAIGSQMFDNFQSSDRTLCDNLFGTLNGIYNHIAAEVLRNTLPDKKQTANDGKRKQYTSDDPDQIRIKVSYVIFAFSSQATDKSNTGSISAGCGNKHHKGNDQHLGEITQTGFP